MLFKFEHNASEYAMAGSDELKILMGGGGCAGHGDDRITYTTLFVQVLQLDLRTMGLEAK